MAELASAVEAATRCGTRAIHSSQGSQWVSLRLDQPLDYEDPYDQSNCKIARNDKLQKNVEAGK